MRVVRPARRPGRFGKSKDKPPSDIPRPEKLPGAMGLPGWVRQPPAMPRPTPPPTEGG